MCRFSLTTDLWFMNPGKDVLLLAIYYRPKEYTIYFLQSKPICYQLSIKDFYLQNCGQVLLPCVVCSGHSGNNALFPLKAWCLCLSPDQECRDNPAPWKLRNWWCSCSVSCHFSLSWMLIKLQLFSPFVFLVWP